MQAEKQRHRTVERKRARARRRAEKRALALRRAGDLPVTRWTPPASSHVTAETREKTLETMYAPEGGKARGLLRNVFGGSAKAPKLRKKT